MRGGKKHYAAMGCISLFFGWLRPLILYGLLQEAVTWSYCIISMSVSIYKLQLIGFWIRFYNKSIIICSISSRMNVRFSLNKQNKKNILGITQIRVVRLRMTLIRISSISNLSFIHLHIYLHNLNRMYSLLLARQKTYHAVENFFFNFCFNVHVLANE